MHSKLHHNIQFIAAVLLMLTTCGCAAWPAKPYIKANSIRPGKMAILPFENLTNHVAAGKEFDDPAPMIFAQFTPMKIATPDAVQEAMKTLGKVSSLTRQNLKSLKGVLGVDYLMVGTVYEFADGEKPAISVGVRVLDAESGDTIWALIVTKKGSNTGKLLDSGSVHTLAITVIEEIAKSFSNSVAEESGKETGSSEAPVSATSGAGEGNPETGAKSAATAPVAPPQAVAQPEQVEVAKEAATMAEKPLETPSVETAPVAPPQAATRPEQVEVAKEAATAAEKPQEAPSAASAPVAPPQAVAQPDQGEIAKGATTATEVPLETPSPATDRQEAIVGSEGEVRQRVEGSEGPTGAPLIAAIPPPPAAETPAQPAEKPRIDVIGGAIAPSPPILTVTVQVISQPARHERIEKDVAHKVAAARAAEPAVCPEGPMEGKAASSGPLPELAIHFEAGKSRVKPGYHSRIAKIAAFLKSNPATSLHIEGHTDNSRSPRHNLALSKRRADAVRRYLEQHFSVASSRITTNGVGCGHPAADNKIPAGREKNRRAVIRIIDSNQKQHFHHRVTENTE